MRPSTGKSSAGHRLAGPVFASLLCLAVVGCGAPAQFDRVAAGAHLDYLGRTIGRRPLGSEANARARAYLVEQLESAGFDVRVQEADAVDATRGLTARVFNVIALRQGQRDKAIGLVAHYDSRADTPGALDDALGVAAVIEAGRVLVSESMQHSLLVMLTDGEEVGLMGARALVTDPDVARRLTAFLNFDSTGRRGPFVLFEAGPGLGPPLEAWAAAAAAPSGGSYAGEIYRRLPNDTDFSVLRSLGAYGLNFAAVDDSYGYHSDRDVPRAVALTTLAHAADTAITVARRLDRAEAEPPDPVTTPTYFDLVRRGGVFYGSGIAWWLSVFTVLAGTGVWAWLSILGWRERGAIGMVATLVWAPLIGGAGYYAMVGAVRLLRATHAELSPWYAWPTPSLVFVGASGLLVAWLLARVALATPSIARPWREPAAHWWIALPVWLVLLVALQVSAPTAAYLVMWPLLMVSAFLAASRGVPVGFRVASLLGLIVTIVFWAELTVRLLGFVVALFGRLPAPLPASLFATILFGAFVMILPPVLALSAARAWRRPGRVTGLLLIIVLVSGGVAWWAPAYTDRRPLRRTLHYVQDDILQTSFWEAGSNEGLLGMTGPPSVGWDFGASPIATTVRLPMIALYRFFAPAPRLVETPLVSLRVVRAAVADGSTRVDLTVTPRQLVAMQLRLPPGVVPVDSSLAGVVSGNRWQASHAAVPTSGLTISLTLTDGSPERLADAILILNVPGVPDGRGQFGLPDWADATSTTWSPRSYVIQRPF